MKKVIFTLLACSLAFGVTNAQMKTITIKEVATAPTIDGSLTDDVWAAQEQVVPAEANGNVEGFSGWFKMCYDKTNIYVAVSVTDPNPGMVGPSEWNTDCQEIFFAMDTTNADAYRPGDWQLRKDYTKAQADGGITWSKELVGLVCEGDGASTEWLIPIAALVEDAAFDGEYFRFDIQLAQASSETGRDGQLFWNSNADDQWSKVLHQGLVQMIPLAVKSINASKASAYISNNSLILNNVSGIVNIYDVTGKLVMKANNASSISVSALKPGMYIVKADNLAVKVLK